MSSIRDGAVRIAPRHRRRRRPMWQLVTAAILVALFAAGLVFGVVRMLSGGSDAAATAPTSAPLPCVTTMVTPAEYLPPVSKVRLRVYNATQRVGLAGTTADELSARGFTVKDVGNAAGNRQVASVGELRYGTKGEKSALLLAYYFPGFTAVQDGRGKKIVDVVLGQEFTAVGDDALVVAAKASPSPVATGAGCASRSAQPVATNIG